MSAGSRLGHRSPPTACCALALLAAAFRIGAKRICGDVVKSFSLINKSSCYLWGILAGVALFILLCPR
jgi:hypothetical protein